MEENPRIKIFYVSWKLLSQLLFGLWDYEHLSLPDFDVIPKDAKCERIFVSHERAAIGFVIRSKSFGPLVPGEVAEEINIPNVAVKKIPFKRKES